MFDHKNLKNEFVFLIDCSRSMNSQSIENVIYEPHPALNGRRQIYLKSRYKLKYSIILLKIIHKIIEYFQ